MSKYVDLYIRTSTEKVFQNNYSMFFDEQGDLLSTPDFEVLILGSVVLEPAQYDEEGEEIAPAVIDTRFHVNVRCTTEFEDQISLKYVISPDTPLAEWI